MNGDRLELSMLGCDDNIPKLIGVDFLQKNLGNKEKTGLDYQVGKALLDLDPFVVTKTSETLTDRYEWVGTVEMRQTRSEYSLGFEKEFSQADWRSKREFTTRVEDYRKGRLSFLGIGVRKEETVESTSWNENISKTTRGEKTGVNLVFYCLTEETYITDIYYDSIFGTFAFESVPPAQTAMLSGSATGPDGKPLVGKMITLMIGAKPIITATNKEGRFEFYSSRIRGGKASLVIDNKIYQEISLSPGGGRSMQ